MRVQPWFVAVLSILWTLSSVTAQDASSPFPPYGRNPYEGGNQMPPPLFSGGPGGAVPPPQAIPQPGYPPPYGVPAPPPAAHTALPPGYAPPAAQIGAPQPMQAWPGISPFDHQFSQHRNVGGLWAKDFNSRGRQFFAGFEILRTRTVRPKGLVGQPGARSYKDVVLPIIADSPFDLEDLAVDFAGSLDLPLLQTGPGLVEPQGLPGFNYYDAQDADALGNVASTGLRFRWGFIDPDDSGVAVDLWWNMGHTNRWSAEHEISTRRLTHPSLTFRIADAQDGLATFVEPFETLAVLEQNLLNLRGIPIDDGTFEVLPDGTTIGGTTIPFDLEYTQSYRSEAFGGSLNFLMTPAVKKSVFTLRPLAGVRYMHIRERFRVDGHDSGMSYDNLDIDDPFFPQIKVQSLPNGLDDNLDGIIDNAGLVERFEDEVRFVRNDIVASILGLEHPGRYQAFLENESVTHLIGPEVGLRYDLGGKRFKLWGHSKFGLLLNRERTSMSGDNMGEANNVGIDFEFGEEDGIIIPEPGDDEDRFFFQNSPLITPSLDDPRPNAFTDRRQHTQFSPLFEQSVFAEMPLFSHAPVLSNFRIFKTANFRVGYTFILVGNVARPSESIRWQANPRLGLFPTIDTKRGAWWTNNWSFAIDWTF